MTSEQTLRVEFAISNVTPGFRPEQMLEVRGCVSDWTYFSGPTADPCRDCTSERALEACEMLAEELDIDMWAQGMDELVLDVENM
jgi:hypothetical protein